jgi:tryptophan-rich sensory protein
MISLVAFLALVTLAGLAGSRFPPDDAYRRLRKPRWNPPDIVFAPVWTLLYLAIAVAGWLVWRATDGRWSDAMTFWAAQLVLNAAWSWLFFGRRQIFAALVDSALMFVAICGFIVTAAALDSLAAWLFVPYVVWVAFATVLNATIWWMNRGTPHSGLAAPR